MDWVPSLGPLVSMALLLATVFATRWFGRGAGLLLALGGAVAIVASRRSGEEPAIPASTGLVSAGLCALLVLGWLLATLERARDERDARPAGPLPDGPRAGAGEQTAKAASDPGPLPSGERELRQISHDLVQPLAAISNYAELIRASSSGEVQGYALEVAGLSTRMAKRIREALNSGRAQTGAHSAPPGTAPDSSARPEARPIRADKNVEGPE
jgi:signal transduction histidine kinase